MARIEDVSNFFIDLGQAQAIQGSGDPITPLKLQKLLYFAQGWHLARYGSPLFEDDFQAWKYGPVIGSVYQKYKIFGSNGILRDSDSTAANVFAEDEYDLLLDVAREYMRYSAAELVRKSHAEGSPWDKAYRLAHQQEIPKSEIEKYFSECEPLDSFEDILEDYPEEAGV